MVSVNCISTFQFPRADEQTANVYRNTQVMITIQTSLPITHSPAMIGCQPSTTHPPTSLAEAIAETSPLTKSSLTPTNHSAQTKLPTRQLSAPTCGLSLNKPPTSTDRMPLSFANSIPPTRDLSGTDCNTFGYVYTRGVHVSVLAKYGDADLTLDSKALTCIVLRTAGYELVCRGNGQGQWEPRLVTCIETGKWRRSTCTETRAV